MSYPPPPPPLKYPPYGEPRKTRAGLIIILAILVVIGCISGAGYLGYKLLTDKSDPSSATTESPSPSTATPSAKPSARPSAKPTAAKPPAAKPTVRPTTRPASQATTVARQFLAHLNANRTSAAVALACPESKQILPTLIDTLIAAPTNLTLGTLTSTSTSSITVFRLTGTTDGQQKSGHLIIQTTPTTCVRLVQLSPTG